MATLTEGMMTKVAAHHKTKAANMQFRRIVMTVKNVIKNTLNFQAVELFSTGVPSRVAFCLVEQDAQQGCIRKNPFSCRHRQVTRFFDQVRQSGQFCL